jgi:hypothetical protein
MSLLNVFLPKLDTISIKSYEAASGFRNGAVSAGMKLDTFLRNINSIFNNKKRKTG